jgi:hypothetical protein
LKAVFWVVLFLPIVFTLLILVLIPGPNELQGYAVVPLIGLGLSMLFCPLYCGIRLGMQWASRPWPRVFLSLALIAGLGIFYLSAALAGCTAIL